ncbi:MAG: GtrA family protein [Pseudomonadota bacterium]
MSFVKRLLQGTFVCYVIGGCIAAGIHIGIVAFLVEVFGVDKENANSVGFVVGVVVNYLFQAFVTFRADSDDHWQQFPLFVGFAVIGLGINRYVFSFSIHDWQLQYLIATALAIGVVFMFNFTCNRLITFRRAPRSDRAHGGRQLPGNDTTRTGSY